MSKVAQVPHSSPDGHIPQLRFPEFNSAWEEKTLGVVAKITTGSTPSTSNNEYYDGNVAFVSPADIQGNRIVRSTKTTITELGLSVVREIKKRSTLFVCIGSTIGKVSQAGVNCATNQQINALTAKNSFDNDFIYSLLESKAPRIKLLAGVQAVPQINKSEFSRFKFTFPLLPEQQKIASFLAAVDEKIEQLIKKQELLGEYKKGLMQQIFSQAIRFKADDGCDFPDWEEKSLGELFNYKNGGSFENEVVKDGLYNLITLNSITIDGELKNEHKKINSFDNSLKINDLIMVLSDVAHGNFLGLTAIIPEDNSYVLNQRMGALKSKGLNNVVFLRLLINYNQKYFKLHGQGSSQQNLSKGDILKFELLLPNRNEQQKIANFLSSIDTKIEQVGKQLDESKQFKKALLQQMFV